MLSICKGIKAGGLFAFDIEAKVAYVGCRKMFKGVIWHESCSRAIVRAFIRTLFSNEKDWE